MSMNQFLSEYYGTTKTASAPEPSQMSQEEQIELFQKLAADEGLDLDKLSEAQITQLWNATFNGAEKTAGEDEKKDEKDEEKAKESEGDDSEKKVEEAKKEHEEKKEAMAKVAEADYLGRVMAHAMTQELQKIAEAKEAGKMPEALKAHFSKAVSKAGKGVESVGKKVTQKLTGVGTSNMKPGHAKAVGAATLGAGAAAAGGAAAVGKKLHDKKKESSAIDDLAASRALDKAAEAGFDADEASQRLAAVLTLGAPESEKIAHAQSIDSAVEVRSLELLEAAGYPVTWG